MIDRQFSRQEAHPTSPPAASAVADEAGSDLLSASLRTLVGPGLAQVESTLASELHSSYPQVNDLASIATSLGGKRLRPMLTLLSALALGRCNDDSIRVGTTVELVHAASLVHDDVLDNAAFRRHQATIHARVGVPRSIMLGDYLFTRAYAVAAKCRSTLPARSIATAATQLCEGELRQQASVGNWQIPESEYVDILRQKTGELCAISCRLGAWSAGGSAAEAHALSRFGRRVGVAFQIMDDWLDIWGTAQVGKTLGTDLAQRKPTLPVIRLLATSPERLRATLLQLLEDSPVRCDEIRQLLSQSDAAHYTIFKAQQLISSAVRELRVLPATPAEACLKHVASQCIQRAS